MKKILILLLAAALMLPVAAGGETAEFSYKKGTYPADAEYIDLGNNTVTKEDMDAFITFLHQFSRLKQVDMFATKIPGNRIARLKEEFPEIEFGMSMIVGIEHIVRTDATAFSTLHGVDNQYEHTAEDFALLKYCRNLYALDIGHNLVDDLSFLKDLPKLRVLIVAKNRLTDITPIAELKDLEYLEVFGNNVTDLSPLQDLPHLVDLNVTGNRIEDLSPLQNITSLRRLWVNNCNKYAELDRAAVEALRQALPEAEIDDVNPGTGGTWRTGDHYKTIQRMFKNSVYEPFDDVSFPEYAWERSE